MAWDNAATLDLQNCNSCSVLLGSMIQLLAIHFIFSPLHALLPPLLLSSSSRSYRRRRRKERNVSLIFLLLFSLVIDRFLVMANFFVLSTSSFGLLLNGQ
uniref:Uncharacterized protein n=1 Tax=Nelumbo nucifera TaxID=4432 RepID=A0A822YNZ8_NELNU|nr:TPA_asm: hypothetical protein HUJ06_011427 [Nelumbo nucifera]